MAKIKPESFTAAPIKLPEQQQHFGSLNPIALANITGAKYLAFRPDAEDGEEEEGEGASVHQSGVFWASTADGKLMKIDPKSGNVSEVLTTGRPDMLRRDWSCKDEGTAYYTEFVCGRPMGIHFDQDGLRLWMVDAYKGLFLVNVEDNTMAAQMGKDDKGEDFTFLNGIAVSDQTGKLYITESSTKLPHRDARAVGLEVSAKGRLLEYDPSTGNMATLKTKLFYPSGVVVVESTDPLEDDFVLISETSKARLRKHYLPFDEAARVAARATRKGEDLPNPYAKRKLFIKLPCRPSGLSWINGKEEVLVACSDRRSDRLDLTASVPQLRAVLSLLPAWLYATLFPEPAMLVRVEPRSGKVLGVITDPTGQLDSVHSAYVQNGEIFLGHGSRHYGVTQTSLKK